MKASLLRTVFSDYSPFSESPQTQKGFSGSSEYYEQCWQTNITFSFLRKKQRATSCYYPFQCKLIGLRYGLCNPFSETSSKCCTTANKWLNSLRPLHSKAYSKTVLTLQNYPGRGGGRGRNGWVSGCKNNYINEGHTFVLQEYEIRLARFPLQEAETSAA